MSDSELASLRARVAELEREVAEVRVGYAVAMSFVPAGALKMQDGGVVTVERATPDPRDARIAELEAALREVKRLCVPDRDRRGFGMHSADIEASYRTADLALGEDHG